MYPLRNLSTIRWPRRSGGSCDFVFGWVLSVIGMEAFAGQAARAVRAAATLLYLATAHGARVQRVCVIWRPHLMLASSKTLGMPSKPSPKPWHPKQGDIQVSRASRGRTVTRCLAKARCAGANQSLRTHIHGEALQSQRARGAQRSHKYASR